MTLFPLPIERELIPVAESIGQQLPINWYGLVGLTLFLLIPASIALIDRRWGRAKLQTGVDAVKEQVTNGGSNLAHTVGEIARKLDIVMENQRVIHDDHLGAINKNIATLNQGIQELRGQLAELKRDKGGADE